MTPYEIIHQIKPDLSQYRAIGSKAYVLIPGPQRERLQKLRARSIEGWITGMAASNIYRVWLPQLQRIICSRDVIVDESIKYDKDHIPSPIKESEIIILASNDIEDAEIQELLLEQLSEQTAKPQEATTQPARQGLQQQDKEIDANPYPSPPTTISETSNQQASEGQRTPEGLAQSPERLQAELIEPREPQQRQEPQELQEQQEPQPSTQSQTQRNRRATDAMILSNLRTSTGRIIKPSEKAIEALNILKRGSDAMQELRDHTNAHSAFAIASTKRHRSDLRPPPEHWAQIKSHPDADEYTIAAQVEVRQLEAKGTFVTVDRPKDKQVLPLKWVFTHKLDTAGYLMRFKARVCVRGDLQMDSGDDLYAATGAYRTFRILIALAAAFNLICHSVDVTNAFLNAILDQEVYVECPPGFKVPGKVWKLNKALYGLRIAPKLWFEELSSFLQSKGYQSCSEEPCLLINKDTGVIVFFYVDDFLLLGPPHQLKEINAIKTALHSKYGIKDLGPATSFLNIKITRDIESRKAWISQEAYIDKLISTFQLQAMLAHPIRTPLPRDFKPTPHEKQATESQIQGYQRRTGSILYLAVVSRPDIAFAVSVLCQFNSNPSTEHQQAANHLLGYLAQTKHLSIEYSANQQAPLQVASDASFADDITTRRSTQGYLMTLFNGPICWQSIKQKTVTTSTTEAELLSLSYTARETIALCRLFAQIQFVTDDKLKIWCDNKQAVGLIQKKRPELTTKLRHVDIHHFWLRQVHEQGLVEVEWIPTEDMTADGFTKPLEAQKHRRFIQQLGMVQKVPGKQIKDDSEMPEDS